MYVFGGGDGVSLFNDTFVLDKDMRWTQVVTSQHHVPSPRTFHASLAYRSCMYIFGGFDGAEPLSDVFYSQCNFLFSCWRVSLLTLLLFLSS